MILERKTFEWDLSKAHTVHVHYDPPVPKIRPFAWIDTTDPAIACGSSLTHSVLYVIRRCIIT